MKALGGRGVSIKYLRINRHQSNKKQGIKVC